IVGHQDLGRIVFGGVNGSLARHAITRPVLTSLTNHYGGEAFPSPPSRLLTGTLMTLPDFAGQSLESVKSLLEGLGFTFRDGGTRPSHLPAGVVTSTNPGAGSRLS